MKRPQEGGDVKETEVSSVEQPESACFPGLAPHHRKWVTHVQRAGRPWTGGPEWKLISFTSSFCLLWLSFPELCLGVKCRAVEEGGWMLQRCPTEHLMGAPGVRVKQNSDVVVVVVTRSCSSGCGRCGVVFNLSGALGDGRRKKDRDRREFQNLRTQSWEWPHCGPRILELGLSDGPYMKDVVGKRSDSWLKGPPPQSSPTP